MLSDRAMPKVEALETKKMRVCLVHIKMTVD